MGRHAAMTALNNAVRSKRQALGLSQQDLATRCHLTRQAISAIEAGQYVPNTTVALRLARLLGCTVEALFRLPEDVTPVEAEWLGEQAVPRTERARVRLGRVGERLVAHPLTDALAVFTPADGLTLPAVQGVHTPTRVARGVRVDLLVDTQLLDNTVIVLGCDPALALLGAYLTRRHPSFRLLWTPRSSLIALQMLGRGEAHAAGTHLLDPVSGESNLPYVRRELAGRHLIVVTLSQWQQGFLVANGNPKGITGAADLARLDVTLVNRDPGSGSRALLDAWLHHAGVAPQQVRGYAREVTSHLTVAEIVANGGADVGPGILAVANALGLDFITLQEERYDLVIPMEFFNADPVQALLDVVVNPTFHDELLALGGYDSSQAGNVVAELRS